MTSYDLYLPGRKDLAEKEEVSGTHGRKVKERPVPDFPSTGYSVGGVFRNTVLADKLVHIGR